MIGTLLGNLKIVSKLGEGGMGVVYLAEHVTLKRRFAVKSLSAKLTDEPGFRERFFNEAVNQALLDHQNIVQATDFFEVHGQYFLVMEFVSGQSLNDLIKNEGKLGEEEAIRILKDILRGLNFAHSKGVIHRDIKPPNVIVDETGRARITDFGIAILIGNKRLTVTGSGAVGSWWYMSPEQIINPAHIDHRSDVYSAGIVLYEMLTGDVPFDGESQFTIQNKQVNDPVPDPTLKNPLVTLGLKKILLKALEKDPDKRFSGCGDFLKDLEEYEKARELLPKPKWSLAKLLGVAVTLLLLAAAGYWLFPRLFPPLDTGAKSPADMSDTAFLWIETATEKASVICREIAQLKLKQEHLKIAQEGVGDSSDFDSLKKQIMEHEANIKEYLDDYQGTIEKLSGLKEATVSNQIKKYDDQLAQKELFPRIKITQIVSKHYQEANAKVQTIWSSDEMWTLCPKQ